MDKKITEKQVFENLRDFKNVANECGIKYWLCEGLLLGLYRDGRPITGDEDDTDVGIEEIDEKTRVKFVKALNKIGLKTAILNGNPRDKLMENGRLSIIQVERGGNTIDILVIREDNGVAWVAGGSDEHRYYLVFPPRFFKKQGEFQWKDEVFKTVDDIEGFLNYKYREWRTPALRGDGYDPTDRSLNRAFVREKRWRPGMSFPDIVGITFGAFDPLHHGHLKLFRNCLKECDKLIVCVSDDDYIVQIKNREPFIPLEGRLEIIKEISCIDTVDIQTPEGKPLLLEKYNPDIIFVGDDWTPQTFKGEGHGIPVVYLPYTKGISSTKIRDET